MQHRSDKDRDVIIYLVAGLVAFEILYHAWFYVLLGLAIIGAVWILQKEKN